MHTYKPGERVAILDPLTSHVTWGTVTRVSPTEKRVWITLDASHVIGDVEDNGQQSYEWHVNGWHGILTVSPYSGKDTGL